MLSIFAAFLLPAWAQFHDLKLENLRSYSYYETRELAGRSSVWILFQPECGSCKRQLGGLNCLPAGVEKIAVGIQGTRERLAAELKFIKYSGKAVAASPSAAKLFGTAATPTILYIGPQGELEQRFSGYTPCSQIASAIRAH